MLLIITVFFVVALLYAVVGFGGASSYIAVLSLSDIPYEHIPGVALLCNLIVVTGGSFFFSRRDHFRWQLFWPFIIGSMPLAFVGANIFISKKRFLLILGILLFLAAIKLLIVDRLLARIASTTQGSIKPHPGLAVIIGAAIGLISGMVGIGGGIFLSPILLLLGWGSPKQVAASASMFILANSVAGLCGQLNKFGSIAFSKGYWLLFLAVLVGGQLGSRLGSGRLLPQHYVRDLSAMLILGVGLRLLWSVASL